jgi:hypothetical protein
MSDNVDRPTEADFAKEIAKHLSTQDKDKLVDIVGAAYLAGKVYKNVLKR